MSDKSPSTRTQSRPRSTSKAVKTKATASAESKTTAATRSLPVLVPGVRVRHIPLPRIEMGHVPVPRVYVPVPDVVRSRLPEPTNNRLIWFGGLAGLAALGVIGWPVAGVVAAGMYVAERRAKAAMYQELAAAAGAELTEPAAHAEA